MEFTKEIGGKKMIVKIGDLANQANGSCLVQYGETTVLATAVLAPSGREGVDYFPLSVEYEEKFYAAGKIKGSRFIKRETRPTDEAVLTARMIDRSIRPLFDQDCRRAVQVVLTVLSIDQENDPDVVAFTAASLALAVSDIDWQGPIAGVRIGRKVEENGEKGPWQINPKLEIQEKSDLNLFVSAAQGRVLMIEAAAEDVGNEALEEAIQKGIESCQEVNSFIKEIQDQVGKEKVPLVEKKEYSEENPTREELLKMTEEIVSKEAPLCLFAKPLLSKQDRIGAAEKIRQKVEEVLEAENIGKEKRVKATEYANKLIYREVSSAILNEKKRIDGRKLDEVRPLNCEVGTLPRVHGSAVFSRGETQVMSIVTLGSPGSEQYLDTMEEESKKRFMHHYNFPPFCTGEARPMRSTGRREIGHGALAEKGMLPIIPEEEGFPYTIRLVSEVLSSNGSSSMASLCASVLALMDAGIQIKKPVAGIAIGLASEEGEGSFKRYQVLTDIQDLEDGPGGMDFKVIGSKEGVTAIQLDTKTKGLTMEIVKETLQAAQKARTHILDKMEAAIAVPRENLSKYAPRVTVLQINPSKIRDVIGPGGKVINEIIEKTGALIDIEQDGRVFISSADKDSLEKAVKWVKDLTRELEKGEIFEGKIVKIMDFGVFIELTPGQDGLLHISKMSDHHVKHPSDLVKEGDKIKVKIADISHDGKISLVRVKE
ncbi:polyribonucleotide nucleotidyltransferase [Patescibacteria group bacterium]|nr:polyribonucleotide nucleotidyltransferase [Patescibacteria group bacterium]